MAKTNPFLFYLDGEAPGGAGLKASRCLDCGHVSMPPVLACPLCASRRIEPASIGRRASLVHHSVVHHPADYFTAPYVVGFVRTAEGPTAFVPILSEAADRLRPGTGLAFRLVDLPDDRTGFAYVPEEAL